MAITKLFIISGPSGCGKTTIANAILKRHPSIVFSVSATTRPRRKIEVHGKDYYFITKQEFETKIKSDELIEWEQIYGDYYGSLKSEVDKAFQAGKSILFDIDVKGALSIKKKFSSAAVLIFIKPPSIDLLMVRLKKRKTETVDTFTKRMNRVNMEMKKAEEFDYCVVNDVLDNAIASVDLIVNRALSS